MLCNGPLVSLPHLPGVLGSSSEEAEASIRFSFRRFTTDREADATARLVEKDVTSPDSRACLRIFLARGFPS